MQDTNLRKALEALQDKLQDDYEAEMAHLKSIAGPTGQRNSPAALVGLAKNDIRAQVMQAITEILEA